MGVVELLIEKKNLKVKVPKSEEKEIAAHYRKVLKALLELRKAGVTGTIEIESYQ